MSQCDRYGGMIEDTGRNRLATVAVLAIIMLGLGGQFGQSAWASGGFGAVYEGITGKQPAVSITVHRCPDWPLSARACR